jgi:hypothetical protein
MPISKVQLVHFMQCNDGLNRVKCVFASFQGNCVGKNEWFIFTEKDKSLGSCQPNPCLKAKLTRSQRKEFSYTPQQVLGVLGIPWRDEYVKDPSIIPYIPFWYLSKAGKCKRTFTRGNCNKNKNSVVVFIGTTAREPKCRIANRDYAKFCKIRNAETAGRKNKCKGGDCEKGIKINQSDAEFVNN